MRKKSGQALRFGVFSPSSYVDKDAVLRAKERLESFGASVKIHPQSWAQHHQSAGRIDEKVEAFHDLLQDDEVDFILTSRGGNQSLYMLEHLSPDLIKQYKKPVIGFSDVTSLLNALYTQYGIIGYHGPCLQTMDVERIDDQQIKQMLALLKAENLTIPMDAAKTFNNHNTQTVQGTLIGGNLSLIQSLVGTLYAPPWKDSILFLEDVGDQLSRYERMLIQLRLAGVLSDVKAIIFGDMHCGKEASALPFGFSFEDCLNNVFDGIDTPVVTGAPFGHTGPLYTMPVGKDARLHIKGQDDVTLECID